MHQLLDLVHDSAVENHRLIISDEVNFSQTNWLSMLVKIYYKKELLGKLIELNLSNFSNEQFDVVLCNNLDSLIKCDYQEELLIDLSHNNKQFSDHKPIETIIESSKFETLSVTKFTMQAFKRRIRRTTSWEKLNECIGKEPFLPFCYSNVDELFFQCHKRLWEKIDKNCPRLTNHQAILAPWISIFTSNIIKRLNTHKKQSKCSQSKMIEMKRLEKQIK